MKPTGILICVPAFGQSMCSLTGQSLFNVAVRLSHPACKINLPVSMCTMSAAEIAEVRNLFLTTWYDGPHKHFSHLLFVDADMEFPAELVLDMVKFNQPLMGCLYAKRMYPAKAVGRCFDTDQTVDDIKQGFMQVAGVGGGVMMISREVVTKMIEKYPEIVDKDVSNHPGAELLGGRLIRAFDPFVSKNGQRLSEDLAFCERWTNCGGEVWANVQHRIGHIGPHNFAIRYADFLENKAADAAKAAA